MNIGQLNVSSLQTNGKDDQTILTFNVTIPMAVENSIGLLMASSQSKIDGDRSSISDDWFHIPKDTLDILSKEEFDKPFVQTICQNYYQLTSVANAWYKNVSKEFDKYLDNGAISFDERLRLDEIFQGVLPVSNLIDRTLVFDVQSFVNFQKLCTETRELAELGDLFLQQLNQHPEVKDYFNKYMENGWIFSIN